MAKNGKGSISNIRKKITYLHEIISTSYHEAGHAIYSLICGMRVPYACIFKNKKNKRVQGFCHYETPDLDLITDPSLVFSLVNYEIGIKYAGLTAEKYHFKIISGSDKFPMFLRDGSSDDTLSAALLIRQYNIAPPGKKRYSYKKRKINQVLKSLKDYWEDVTLLAHLLFKKKRLSFFNIKNLLLKKSPNKKFWISQFKMISDIFDKNMHLDEKYLKLNLVT
jgi:hypothetical protein